MYFREIKRKKIQVILKKMHLFCEGPFYIPLFSFSRKEERGSLRKSERMRPIVLDEYLGFGTDAYIFRDALWPFMIKRIGRVDFFASYTNPLHLFLRRERVFQNTDVLLTKLAVTAQVERKWDRRGQISLGYPFANDILDSLV